MADARITTGPPAESAPEDRYGLQGRDAGLVAQATIVAFARTNDIALSDPPEPLASRSGMQDGRPMRYGDFPRLFEGFPPDEEVDFYDTRTILRLMAFAESADNADPPHEAALDEAQPVT
jgi:hypothetical protein